MDSRILQTVRYFGIGSLFFGAMSNDMIPVVVGVFLMSEAYVIGLSQGEIG